MKRLVLFAAILLCVSLDIMAQNTITVTIDKEVKSPEPFEGVWQMALIQNANEEEVKARFLPIFKVYGADGTFKNISFGNGMGAGMLMTHGMFKASKKGKYTESIKASATDPAIVGKDNVLQYKYIKPHIILISYQLPNLSQPSLELWIKVTMPIFKKKTPRVGL